MRNFLFITLATLALVACNGSGNNTNNPPMYGTNMDPMGNPVVMGGGPDLYGTPQMAWLIGDWISTPGNVASAKRVTFTQGGYRRMVVEGENQEIGRRPVGDSSILCSYVYESSAFTVQAVQTGWGVNNVGYMVFARIEKSELKGFSLNNDDCKNFYNNTLRPGMQISFGFSRGPQGFMNDSGVAYRPYGNRPYNNTNNGYGPYNNGGNNGYGPNGPNGYYGRY